MSDQETVDAQVVGTPEGGLLDNPWPSGKPADGERVALFSYEILAEDGEARRHSSYHVAPASLTAYGPVGAPHADAQGLTVQWIGAGEGVVVSVRPAVEADGIPGELVAVVQLDESAHTGV